LSAVSHRSASLAAGVGSRLRRLRKERRLTQSDLARQIGIQQSDLSRMEKGEYRVSLDNLFKILAALEVSATAFFADQREAPRPAPVPLSHTDMQLLQMMRELSPEAREEVHEFADFKLRRERAVRRRTDVGASEEQGG
jgi:transcriptional regulator with XRE-family HTH domain